jgi:hypothetical protein
VNGCVDCPARREVDGVDECGISKLVIPMRHTRQGMPTPAECPLREGPISLVLLGVGWGDKPYTEE